MYKLNCGLTQTLNFQLGLTSFEKPALNWITRLLFKRCNLTWFYGMNEQSESSLLMGKIISGVSKWRPNTYRKEQFVLNGFLVLETN